MLKRELHLLPHDRSWGWTDLNLTRVPFQWHYHPEYEITLTLGAEGMRYIGEDVDSFGACDLTLITPNVPHTWDARPGENQQVYVIFLPEDWLRRQCEAGLTELHGFARWLKQVGAGVVFSPGTATRAKPLFTQLKRGGLGALGALYRLFALLMQDQGARLLGGRNTSMEDKRLGRLLAYLQQHYQQPLRLERVADFCAISPATLKRLLASHCETSFSQYLNHLRLGHACHLLTTSTLAISVIREQAGFSNASHFNRLFLTHTGLRPQAFRSRFGWRKLQ
ncbi:AraC family transcriptional regulator [Zobellella aerophila]|uniref:AraC family transcriptional regulator n=1 Tax=Zobellella aerophila TaxID=870480 RepID=A0ABP6VFS3_9GAMM